MTSNDKRPSKDLELTIERTFDAPAHLVYRMWAEPEHMSQWSCPTGFTIPEARTDFRVGGTFYARMRSPQGEDHRVQGTYRDIVEDKRISFTHAWLDADGNPGPETFATVTFETLGRQTRMVFKQTGFTSKQSRDGHEGGWTQSFAKLEALVRNEAARLS